MVKKPIMYNCDECIKNNPLRELIVQKAPISYEVDVAMEENVRLGRATKKWDKSRKCWTYGITKVGEKHIEELLKEGRENV